MPTRRTFPTIRRPDALPSFLVIIRPQAKTMQCPEPLKSSIWDQIGGRPIVGEFRATLYAKAKFVGQFGRSPPLRSEA